VRGVLAIVRSARIAGPLTPPVSDGRLACWHALPMNYVTGAVEKDHDGRIFSTPIIG
jgi:hypothetical protein